MPQTQTGNTSPRRLAFQFTTRELFAFVTCVAIGCGLIVTSTNSAVAGEDVGVLSGLLGVAFLGAAIGVVFHRPVLTAVIIGLLAFINYSVSHARLGHLGFPPAEINIVVVDTQGKPVERATLDVLSTRPVAKYPISEYPYEKILSNGNGRILCHQNDRNCSYSGRTLSIFGVIPIGRQPPGFTVKISHPDYQSEVVPIEVLFEPELDGSGQPIKKLVPEGLGQLDYYVCRHRVVLQRVRD